MISASCQIWDLRRQSWHLTVWLAARLISFRLVASSTSLSRWTSNGQPTICWGRVTRQANSFTKTSVGLLLTDWILSCEILTQIFNLLSKIWLPQIQTQEEIWGNTFQMPGFRTLSSKRSDIWKTFTRKSRPKKHNSCPMWPKCSIDSKRKHLLEKWFPPLSKFSKSRPCLGPCSQIYFTFLRRISSWPQLSLGWVCGPASQLSANRENYPQQLSICSLKRQNFSSNSYQRTNFVNIWCLWSRKVWSVASQNFNF